MAGALMCVWQAVAASDTTKREASTSLVRFLTKQFAKSPEFKYTEAVFQNTFPEDSIDYDAYKEYVAKKLVSKTTPQHVADDLIEKFCWETCLKTYKFPSDSPLTQDDYYKLWQMFNRISCPGTCPPVVEVNDMNWWASKIALPIRKRWTDLLQDMPALTFMEAFELLNGRVFSREARADAQRSVEQLHAWLVREVSITGWMYKRTRKQSNNWTTWQRRYFVLLPCEVRYYTSNAMREKDFKGKVAVNSMSRLEALNDFKSLTRKYPNRLRISNQPIIELELSCVTEHEKRAWMAAVEEVISAARTGTTPVQAVLAERLAQHQRGEPRESIDQAVSRLKSVRLSKVPDSFQNAFPEQGDVPVKPKDEPVAPVFSGRKMSLFDAEADSDEEVFDNNTYAFEKTKVRQIFDQIDADKNGLLNEREFDEFIRMLVGRSTDDSGMPLYMPIFEEIVEDGERVITFHEFYTYFTRLVLDQTPGSEAEAALKAEFMSADKEGLGAVDFKDLAEFVWDRRRSFRYRKLLDTLNESPAKRESWCPIFTRFVQIQYGGSGNFSDEYLTAESLGEQVTGEAGGERLIADLAVQLADLWQEFTTDKQLRSTDADRIAANYSLIDVACYSTAKGVKPDLLAIDAARWDSDIDRTFLILPPGAGLHVPVMDATDALLTYYGCKMADIFQEQVALLYEHRIENLGYSNAAFANLGPNVVGGPGLEKSSRCRFDSPLSNNGGYILIGRWEGDEETLEVTAFRLPMNTSVYIPAGCLYSLDYADGSWRTVKQPDAKIEQAPLRRQFTANNDRDLESVRFTFD